MSNIFDIYYKKYDAWYDRNKFAYLSELEAVKRVLPRKGKGLEIGVGTGRFAYALGIKYGIDPSKNMIRIAEKRGVNVKQGYGERVPFEDNVFDYAAIIISICFVKNPQKVLEEANRVLRENGKIIIGIVDKESFLGKFYQKKTSVFYKQAKFLSVKEVMGLIEETGFVFQSHYQTIFTLPDKMSLVEKPKKGYGKGGFVVIAAGKR